jgi:CRP/FNR family transcriptional regulator, cyclic AMP receptor protein
VDDAVAKAGLFHGVEPGAAFALARQLQPVDFPRGHTVFAQGVPGDRLYIIISGKVKICRRSPDDREHLLAIMGPSDMFGELAVFDPPGPRTSIVTTITAVRAVSVDRDGMTLAAMISVAAMKRLVHAIRPWSISRPVAVRSG